jgi:hypothetical protein
MRIEKHFFLSFCHHALLEEMLVDPTFFSNFTNVISVLTALEFITTARPLEGLWRLHFA